jgi:hypothetical protein
MNHEAIYAIYPEVVTVDDAKGAFDKDGNKVEIDINVINDWVNPYAYKNKRLSEYPPIGDQLDALWKGGDAAAEMLLTIQAIKTKYPKVTT